MNSIFQVRNLKISYKIEGKYYPALKDISFEIPENKITGIIGESGCGKSTLGLSLLGILKENSKIENGEILFKGKDIFSFSKREMINFRREKIGYIHQNPFEALNPIVKIKKQLKERYYKKDGFYERVSELLRSVRIYDYKLVLEKYPFELSGGQNQRISIVSALLPDPEVLIADEPTTALDVTVQAGILSHILKVKEKFNLTLIFISHDISLVSVFTDFLIVLYSGKIVEGGNTEEVIKNPIHPYTAGLLKSLISIDRVKGKKEELPLLETIKGNVPSITEETGGCPFFKRCDFKKDICQEKFPQKKTLEGKDHFYFCHLF